jgi:hypothetical protein
MQLGDNCPNILVYGVQRQCYAKIVRKSKQTNLRIFQTYHYSAHKKDMSAFSKLIQRHVTQNELI